MFRDLTLAVLNRRTRQPLATIEHWGNSTQWIAVLPTGKRLVGFTVEELLHALQNPLLQSPIDNAIIPSEVPATYADTASNTAGRKVENV